MNKMQQSTKEMSEKINTTVQESVQKGVDAINNLKGSTEDSVGSESTKEEEIVRCGRE